MSEAGKPRRFLSDHFYNTMSGVGLLLVIVVAIGEAVLFGIDFFSGSSNLYLGLFTYVVLPPFLIAGLILIPVGYFRKRRRTRLRIDSPQHAALIIDLSKPQCRNLTAIGAVVLLLFVIMTAIGSYKAFHYTESVSFCGVLCHNVMKPEFVTYAGSPHARVKCVECHIGAGAGWYVHSKLSGMRQVFKTIQGSYPRPVPVPVHNLRPAKETCEECHWPGKLFGNVELERNYFASEAGEAPRWTVRMLMHVSARGQKDNGIHAHMYINNKVYYVPSDDKRQTITWVKTVSKSGEETIFTSKDSPYRTVPPPPEKIRSMDCIDCHSRPSHHFEAPVPLVDRAMLDGRINADIPQIKTRAVDALAKKYATEQEAVESIRASLLKYYQEKQAEYFAAHTKEIQDSIEQVVLIFKHDFFPEMKARWDEYPDNIGHLISQGCFRCHDGEHETSAGRKITRECDTCHTIIGQGPSDKMDKNIDGMPFRHPFNDDESWKEMNCTACHSGS